MLQKDKVALQHRHPSTMQMNRHRGAHSGVLVVRQLCFRGKCARCLMKKTLQMLKVLVGKGCRGACCRYPQDIATQRHFGQTGMSIIMKQCGEVVADSKNPPPPGSVQEWESDAYCVAVEAHKAGGAMLTRPCAECYGSSIQCSEAHCLAQCACVSWQEPSCNSCMTRYCKRQFDLCSGLS